MTHSTDAGFRQLILDRLAARSAEWREEHPADVGMVLVELLAHAGELLRANQDVVAGEAYLGTARRRVSVRRHARLLDYALHEGCNARLWVHVEVDADRVLLPAGSAFFTHVLNQPTCLTRSNFAALDPAIRTAVFESMRPEVLHREHNWLELYCWGHRELALDRGATKVALRGHFPRLKAGHVLIFEETTRRTPADFDEPTRRAHPIRISAAPTLTSDPSTGQPITEIRWSRDDALPFRLVVRRNDATGESPSAGAVALGNVVLADAGRSVPEEWLPDVPPNERFAPELRSRNLVFCVAGSDTSRAFRSARTTLVQDPREAAAAIRVVEESDAGEYEWCARPDLVECDRLSRSFVVEPEADGRTTLRFGDGVHGRKPTPGTRLRAAYRIQTEDDGNVGPDTIAHVVANVDGIVGVRNPLASSGAVPPETLEEARAGAPRALTARESCATAQDYAAAVERHPDARQAVAWIDWRVGERIVTIAVDRRDRRPVDPVFRRELLEFLEPRRIAGHVLDVVGARYVPLLVRLTVRLAPSTRRNVVHQRLVDRFGSGERPGSSPGFFHPTHVGFGQPIYASQLVAATLDVDGVVDAEVDALQRWGAPSRGELVAGVLRVAFDEIVRVDGDARAPECGEVQFRLEGGR